MQRHWRPIDGVGEISDEQFAGNYMMCGSFLELFSYKYNSIILAPIEKIPIEHRKNLIEEIIPQSSVENVKSLTKKCLLFGY